MLAPRKERLLFLAGLIDSDGDLASGCFNVTQKREDWARGIWRVARSLGFCATIKPRKGRCKSTDGRMFVGDYWRVTISGDTHLIPTRIPRKRAAPRRQKKIATRTGFRIEPVGVGEYFGFQLDGDGRFLLGDFTVTHNSTLMMQICASSRLPALIATGEETIDQAADRARRIGAAASSHVLMIRENRVEEVLQHALEVRAQLIAIDSIHTLISESTNGRAGTPNQVRACADILVNFAKNERIPVIALAHINNDDAIAGPKTLAHIVDVVLMFDLGGAAPRSPYRVLWCDGKNRFGATNVVGRMIMTPQGLAPAPPDDDDGDEADPASSSTRAPDDPALS